MNSRGTRGTRGNSTQRGGGQTLARSKQEQIQRPDYDLANGGENAIAGFSFAGLMFPGGELPVRLICQP